MFAMRRFDAGHGYRSPPPEVRPLRSASQSSILRLNWLTFKDASVEIENPRVAVFLTCDDARYETDGSF